MDDTELAAPAGADLAAEAAAVLAAAMPGTPRELARRLLMEVAEPMGISGDPARAADDAAKVAAALQAIAAAGPRDGLEAMLAAQMAAAHMAAMRATRRAAQCADHPQIEALYMRQAARLMALFARQTEVLARLRAREAARAGRAAQARETADEDNPPICSEKGTSRRQGRRIGNPPPSFAANPALGGARPGKARFNGHALNGAAPPG